MFKLLAPGRSVTLRSSLALPFPTPGRAAGALSLLQEQVLVKVGEMRGVVTLPHCLCDLQSLSLAWLEAIVRSSLCVRLC